MWFNGPLKNRTLSVCCRRRASSAFHLYTLWYPSCNPGRSRLLNPMHHACAPAWLGRSKCWKVMNISPVAWQSVSELRSDVHRLSAYQAFGQAYMQASAL